MYYSVIGKTKLQKAGPCALPYSHYIYLCSLLFWEDTYFLSEHKKMFILLAISEISAVKFSKQKADPPLPLLLELTHLP